MLFALLVAGSAVAAPACRNAPRSELRLYPAQPTATEEDSATRGAMDRIAHDIAVSPKRGPRIR